MDDMESKKKKDHFETAIFAAGCFWGVEEAFFKVSGVMETSVGYAGGTVKDPTYEMVCGGATGHAEATRVVFDPAKVPYEKLLETFWRIHDAAARGTGQYRSAIFYTTPGQKAAVERSKAAFDDAHPKHKAVTQIAPAGEFYKAEEYHQKYFQKHGSVACPM